MARIETKRIRRPFPMLTGRPTKAFTGVQVAPGTARAMARQMALEGAALLARAASMPAVGSPALGDLAVDDPGRLAKARRRRRRIHCA